MPRERHNFKRLILGLQPGASNRAMRFAVEMAELLDLDLLGLFLEDGSLRELAGIPFAREFRPLGGGWQPFDLDRLAHDLEIAARGVERLFTSAVKDLARRSQFEVIRGPVREALISTSGTSDIVMIVEPASAAERISAQFSTLIEAAFRSAAAVLLVPPRIARSTGPIVAIATSPQDPSIDAAAAIAAAAKETLVLVEADRQIREDPHIARLADDTGLTVRHVAAAGLATDPSVCLNALHPWQERLLVLARPPSDGAIASALAAARQVPVLVIEPEMPPLGENSSVRSG